MTIPLTPGLIQRIFTDIAARYEQDIVPFFGPLAESLIASLPSEQTRGLALDLGSGTGVAARSLARRGMRVIGIDLVPAMLNVANRVSPSRHDTYAVRYIAGDLHAPPFAPAAFDLAVSSFGLNSTHSRQSLRQVRRVLKAGGWFALQEWGPLDPLSRDIGAVYERFTPDSLLDELDTLARPYEAWENALQDTEDYRDALAEAGFGRIEVSEDAPVSVHASVENYLNFTKSWPSRQLILRSLSDIEQAQFDLAMREAAHPYATFDGSVTWTPPLIRASAQAI